jgi:hypothetical protein
MKRFKIETLKNAMRLLARLTDVHCHVIDTPETLGDGWKGLQTGTLILMGTRPGDWEAVEELHRVEFERG